MAHQQSYAPGGPPGFGQQPPAPEPPRNARGETPVETERRWLSNIAAVVLPMFLAGKLLKPKYRCGRPDPTMEKVVRVRAWLGLTVVFGVFLRVFYEKKTGSGNSIIPGYSGSSSIPTAVPSFSMPSFSMPSMPSMPSGFGVPTAAATPTPTPTGGSGGIPGLDQGAQQINELGKTAATMSDAVGVGQELAGAVIDRVIIAPILCALGVVVIGLVLAMFAAPHARTATIRQLQHPIRTIVLFAVVTAAGIGAYLGLHHGAGLRHKTYMINEDGTTLQLVLSWASAFVLLWTVLFAVGALWQVTRHLFAAIDGHPLLPALLAIWLAWTLVLNDISLGLADDWSPLTAGVMNTQDTVPDNVKAALGILGATVVTVLALWEIARIGKWNGINLRSGPFGNRQP